MRSSIFPVGLAKGMEARINAKAPGG
jgi:hypothetical protein